MEQRLRNKTLKGSLSVLKLMPGTYLSQTGNPLNITPKKKKKKNRKLKTKKKIKKIKKKTLKVKNRLELVKPERLI